MQRYTFSLIWQKKTYIAAGVPEGDTFYLTFFDDILATGGTACGIAEDLNRQRVTVDGKEYKVKVKEFIFLVEFPDLYDHARINSIAPRQVLHPDRRGIGNNIFPLTLPVDPKFSQMATATE